MWLIGGGWEYPPGSIYPLNDVWSSIDGRYWELESGDAPFAGRFEHTAVVGNGRMFMMGGTDWPDARLDGRRNDFWYTDITPLSGSMSEGMFSILANGSLVKKTYIPHEVFPLVAVLSNLFHFVLTLLVYFVLLYLFYGHLTWHVVFLPGVIAIHTFFVLGIAMLLSALNVFYRDIASINSAILFTIARVVFHHYAGRFADEV